MLEKISSLNLFEMPSARLVFLCVTCGLLLWMVVPWSGRLSNLSQLREINWVKAEFQEHLADVVRLYNLSLKSFASDELPPADDPSSWKTILFWDSWFGTDWTERLVLLLFTRIS